MSLNDATIASFREQGANPELAQKVREEIMAGAKLTHIARKYSLSLSVAHIMLDEGGISYRQLLDERNRLKKPKNVLHENMMDFPAGTASEQQIIEEIKTGAKMAVVARKYSLTFYMLNKVLIKHGVIINKPGDNPELARKVIEEINSGKTKTEVARQNSLSIRLIGKMLAKAGINYRQLMDACGKNIMKLRNRALQEPTASREQLMQELCDITTQLGRIPQRADLASLSKFDYRNYRLIFGKLNFALKEKDYLEHIKSIGVKNVRRHPTYGIPSEEQEQLMNKMIEYLKQKAHLQGYAPSSREMQKDTVYPYFRYYQVFGRYGKARELAGLKGQLKWEKEHSIKRTPEQQAQLRHEMIEYLRQKAQTMGYIPIRDEMYQDPVHNYTKYYRVFGGYEKALKIAGLAGMQKFDKDKLMKKLSHMVAQTNILGNTLQEPFIEEDSSGNAISLTNEMLKDLEELRSVLSEAKYQIPELKDPIDFSESEKQVSPQ